jgi:hypothetical protein
MITDEVLKEAVATRFSECYGAMSMANALCGKQTDKWELLNSHTAIEIIEECKSRGIDFENIRITIPDTYLVKDTMAYKLLYPIATQEEYEWTEQLEKENAEKVNKRVEGWDYLYSFGIRLRQRMIAYKRLQKQVA